jgi:MFS family permease
VRVVLATTVLGWIVTSLDLQLSAFLNPQITSSLHTSASFVGNVFFVFAVGLALGALVLGYFSDLWIGRKRAFMYSILGTIVLTGVTGVVHAPWQFVLVRFFAGFFSGGEWILGLSILSEVAPQRHRSLMLGATQAGVGVGYGIANIFAATFAAPGATQFGWRLAYWASFGFAALTYIVRLRVEESPVWQKAVEHGDDRRQLVDVMGNAKSLFRSKQLRLTLLAIGLFIAIGEPQGTWDFLYPTWYGKVAGIGNFGPHAITYAYELAIVVSTLAAGWFMDRYSAKWVMPVVWLSVPFTVLIWQTSASHFGGFYVQAAFLFLAGLGRQAAWAVVAGYFPVLFPTKLRGTGMGLTWVGGWLLGYTASAAWGPHVQAAAGWDTWWLLQVILLVLMPLPMLFAGVETKGKRLDFQERRRAGSEDEVATAA